MNEDFKNIQKLAKMLSGKQLIDTEDLKGMINDIANVFAQYRSASQQINKDHERILNEAITALNKEHDKILGELETTKQEAKNGTIEALASLREDLVKFKDEVIAMKPKDGENGMDADEERIIEELSKRIPNMPEIPDLEEYDKTVESRLEEIKKHIKRSINGFPGVRLLSALMDTNISNPSDGEVLTYNGTTGRWENTTASSGAYSILTATGTVDDTNTIFTFVSKPTEIVINGLSYIENNGWTWSAGTATIFTPVGTGGSIYGRS